MTIKIEYLVEILGIENETAIENIFESYGMVTDIDPFQEGIDFEYFLKSWTSTVIQGTTIILSDEYGFNLMDAMKKVHK